MDYSELKLEVLRALRGPLTQMELSRRLGYNYNQVNKWETHRKQIKWTDFYDLCVELNIPLEDSLRSVFLLTEGNGREISTLLESLRRLDSLSSIENLASQLNCHESVVRRWFSGIVCADLESVFAIMDLRSNFLCAFIAKIVDVSKIPCLEKTYTHDIRLHEFDSQYPFAIVILLCFGLKEYKELPRHCDQFVSDRTGFPVVFVREIIHKMILIGRLKMKEGKYCHEMQEFNTNGNSKTLAHMNWYWRSRSLDRFCKNGELPTNNKNRPNFMSYSIVSVSKEGMSQIFKVMSKCHEQIMQIVQKDQLPEEEIRIILMDSFGPDDIPFQHKQNLETSFRTSSESELQLLEKD